MAAARRARQLSDEELADLLALAKTADSVELKLTVPGSGQGAKLRALDVDPLEAQIRQVFFFDTPDLALDAAGMVVRHAGTRGSAATR